MPQSVVSNDRIAMIRRERDVILLAKAQGYRWLNASQIELREQLLAQYSAELDKFNA